MASVVFGDHLLKAEAKKKKSKSKNKKAKQKSSKKAKEKQSKKAKQLAKMKKQVDSMQKQLLAMKAVVDKRVEADKQSKQQAINALRNIEATNVAQVANLNLAPAKPIITNTSSVCGTLISCSPLAAGVTSPSASYGAAQTKSLSQHFTTQNAHVALTACGFEQTVVGAVCGVADGLLYAFDGDWLGAGLSAGSAIPFIGATADFTKMFKLATAATRSALLGARNVPELLALADAKKIADASAGNVKVLHGTADDGKAVFEAHTKGWNVLHQSNDVITKVSPDGKYNIGYRTKSTDAARGSVSKINGTIDATEYRVLSNGYREKIDGSLVEIKFAE